MKKESFIIGLAIGIILGFIGVAIMVNTIAKPTREKAMYSQGVLDGIKGNFSIQVTKQEVLWCIVPIDSNK